MSGTRKKEEKMANHEQYRAVLDDLLKQRTQLQYKIVEIDSAVSALSRLMPETEAAPPPLRQIPLAISSGKYAGMSVRWGVLCLLSEDATAPLATGEVAEALKTGGTTTKGKNFAANVSAVLSEMNRIKGEVLSTDGKWTITPVGKEAWIHAKASRGRHVQMQATEPELLSVQ